MEFNRKAPLRVKMLLQTHLVLIETHRARCSLFRHQPRAKLYIRLGRRKSVGLLVAWAFLRKVREKRRLRPTLRSGHDFFKMVWSSFLSIIFSFVPLLQRNLISPSTSDVILKKGKQLAHFAAISGYWPICLLRAKLYFSDKHLAGCFYSINWNDCLHRNVPLYQGLLEYQARAEPQHFRSGVLLTADAWGFGNIIKTISKN